MGFWKKFAGYAMMAGGVALVPYTGGASLALTSAGSNFLKDEAQKEGSEKAADAIVQAADKADLKQQQALDTAIETQVQGKEEAKQAYSPYTQLGSNAASALNDYMGFAPLTLGAVGGTPTATATGSTPFVPTPLTPPPGWAGHKPSEDAEMTGRHGIPRDAANAPTVQQRASYQTQSGYTPTLGSAAGGFVRMRAPNGQTKLVPQEQMAQFQARGAAVVA